MPLLRKGGEPHEVSVAMTGVRLGDRLLQLGCANPKLLGAIASKVGISGHAAVLVTDAAAAARAAREAARAGVLVEIEQASSLHAPYEDGSFDLVVVDNTGNQLGPSNGTGCTAWFREMQRLLVPRGRLVAIDAAGRGAFSALFKAAAARTESAAGGATATALKSAGFRSVRTLAERDGLVFTEGVK